VLPDVENMGITVRIPLISFMEADIYVISYLLPVIGNNLRFLPTFNFVFFSRHLGFLTFSFI